MSALLATLPTFAMAPWMNRADPPHERAVKLLQAMTFEEKTTYFHGANGGYIGNVAGIPRLGVPPIKMQDGPQGFRGDPGTSTQFPCGLAIGATFDREVAHDWGKAMGKEFWHKGANVQLGPGLCLARVPRNGRNFEYLSGEDPVLGRELAGPAISGIQGQGVVANAKHWINNNQETDRGSVDEEVDERTQFELYYPPFEGAIAAGVGSVMCSYNRVRGVYSCENAETLQRDLKDRLGFKGWVMSDWGATHSLSVKAGLDMEMPGSDWLNNKSLAQAFAAGKLTQSRIDDTVLRTLTPLFAVGTFDDNNTNTNSGDNNVSTAENIALARRIAGESLVLLKNDDGVLPLRKRSIKIAIIGREATSPTTGGGGSGQVAPAHVPTPYDVIRDVLGIAPAPPSPPPPLTCGASGRFDVGFDYRNAVNETMEMTATPESCCSMCSQRTKGGPCRVFSFAPGKPLGRCYMKGGYKIRAAAGGMTSGPLPPPPAARLCDTSGSTCVMYDEGVDKASAAALAAKADVAIVFVATNSHEGADRLSLAFDNDADALVAAVAAGGAKKVVVAAVSPGAALTPWRDAVHAITFGFMPGQQYAPAVADILFGDVNPSAKLPISLPATDDDLRLTDAMWPGTFFVPWKAESFRVANYAEQMLVGYRYYDAQNLAPAFPFGHGLSFSEFTLSGLDVTNAGVSANLTNTGKVAGAAVVQLYLGFPKAVGEPPKQLKGFHKQLVQPGQSMRVTFALSARDRSIWDVATHKWVEVDGPFQVSVGLSSRDPKALQGTLIGKSGVVEEI